MKISQIHVVHIITGLQVGGAERMLEKLVCATDRKIYKTTVVSLTNLGAIGKSIVDCGVQVHCVGMKQGSVSLKDLIVLVKLIRRIQPDIIMGWMYHGNIAALVAKILSSWKVKLLWNIRHTPYDLSKENRLTSVLIRLSAKLSSIPARVVYNSHVSFEQHKGLGFHPNKGLIIPNGFNTDRFRPSSNSRVKIRTELGIPDNALVLGHIARFHLMKDHKGFLNAVSSIVKIFPDTWFVLAGRDVSWSNVNITDYLEILNLNNNILLLDERDDVSELLSAFDLLCLSSAWGEGFPNIIGEAMSCGVPCVTTDVGDAGIIVGDTRFIVSPGNPEMLANTCCEFLQLELKERQIISKSARLKIKNNYSLNAIVTKYQSLYGEV
jgi:glycosyltransferase involved in cell wall biosynthesis